MVSGMTGARRMWARTSKASPDSIAANSSRDWTTPIMLSGSPLHHWQAGVSGLDQPLADFEWVLVKINPIYVRPRCHHALNRSVAQPQHSRNHPPFAGLDHTGRLGFRHDALDLFLCDCARRLHRITKQPKHQLG